MNKKTITVFSVVALLVIISGMIIAPLLKIEEYTNNNVYSSEVFDRFAPNGKYQTGICKLDLVKPEVYTIFNEGDNLQHVIFSEIERDNILDQSWKYTYIPNAKGGLKMNETNYEEAIRLFEENNCDSIREMSKFRNFQASSEEDIKNFEDRVERESQEDIERQTFEFYTRLTDINNRVENENLSRLEAITLYEEYLKPIEIAFEELALARKMNKIESRKVYDIEFSVDPRGDQKDYTELRSQLGVKNPLYLHYTIVI
ncbi:MAG: hypothetical protein HC932_02965 [Thermales bacterium]|nr:hypothetical protein [Thermales bacterium]